MSKSADSLLAQLCPKSTYCATLGTLGSFAPPPGGRERQAAGRALKISGRGCFPTPSSERKRFERIENRIPDFASGSILLPLPGPEYHVSPGFERVWAIPGLK